MAVLSEQERFDTWRQYMKDNLDPFTLTKTELRAGIDAADVWVQDNKVSFNNALPAAAKAELSALQKSQLLTYVAAKRFGGGI